MVQSDQARWHQGGLIRAILSEYSVMTVRRMAAITRLHLWDSLRCLLSGKPDVGADNTPRPLLTRTRHRPDRNPAAQHSSTAPDIAIVIRPTQSVGRRLL